MCAFEGGAQRVQLPLDAPHIGKPEGSQVEKGTSLFRNHIGAGTALDYVGVDTYSTARVVPFFESGDLRSQFVDGVDAFLRGEAGVRSAAMHRQFSLTNTFARCF